MSKLLAQHWPHLIFVGIGVIAFLWTAYRPERTADHRREPIRVEESGPHAPANVKRSVARRGLLALGPLLGAMATGATLYGLDVGGASGDSIPGAVIWVHAGISTLALLLVVYKVANLAPNLHTLPVRIRRAFSRQRVPELVSLVLGVVSVPLAVTGVALLFAPSTRSFFAYTHLVSSAWWTGLLVWHLRRYLGPSLRAVLRPGASRDSADPGALVPVDPRRDRIERRAA
jgi:hypothetical protein